MPQAKSKYIRFYLPAQVLPSALPPLEKLIYGYYGNYMHFTGSRLRNKRLAYKFGVSERTIRRAIAHLQQCKIIRIKGKTSRRRIFLI